jgi:hypothetical protein
MKKTLAIALLASTCVVQAAPKTKNAAQAKPDLIAQAHERVKDSLKDPDSAKFKSDFAGKDGAVCGFVNAKNSYGGYGGFVRYIATPEHVVMDGDESWKMDSRWFDVCADFEPVAKQ